MLKSYDNLSFEDATRIIYWNVSGNKNLFSIHMEELMNNSGNPSDCIPKKWYNEYKQYLADHKKEK